MSDTVSFYVEVQFNGNWFPYDNIMWRLEKTAIKEANVLKNKRPQQGIRVVRKTETKKVIYVT